MAQKPLPQTCLSGIWAIILFLTMCMGVLCAWMSVNPIHAIPEDVRRGCLDSPGPGIIDGC